VGQSVAASAASKVGRELIAAIATKRRVAFTYHGRRRSVAEPQCLGFTFTDKESLRAYLPRGGGRTTEPLFTVAEMTDFVVLDEHFSRPGPNYKKGDSAMKTILAEL
jgi:hypothetical protein